MEKKILGLYIVIIAAFIGSSAISSQAASSKYAAKVNGVNIKNVTLEAAMTNFVENQKMVGINIKEEEKDALRKSILEELISAELLYQESKKMKLGNIDKEVAEQFENIKKGFSSEEEFKKVLKERGINEKALKNDIRKGVSIRTYLQKDVYNDIVIDEERKKQEYEKNKDKLNMPDQVRASHILINVPQDASPETKVEAREKIEALRKRALSGEDFSELARENSQGPSAPNGGDLGYFKRKDMVPEFEEAAFNLEEGQISEVVQTTFGYHIIKLLDKMPAHTVSYEDIEKDIERFLSNQYRKERLEKLVVELRKGAKIKTYIE